MGIEGRDSTRVMERKVGIKEVLSSTDREVKGREWYKEVEFDPRRQPKVR